MTNKNEGLYELKQKLKRSKAIGDVVQLFDNAFQVREQIGLDVAIDFVNSLIDAAASATRESGEAVASLIDQHLMPFIELEVSNAEARDAPRFDIEQRYLRQRIRDWIYQYPYAKMQNVRKSFLENIEKRLRTKPMESHFLCISKIGYRTESLDQLLWDITLAEGGFSESAGCTLVSTGLNDKESNKIIDLVARQVSSGRGGFLAQVVIQNLIGPRSMDIAEAHLVRTLAQPPSGGLFDPSGFAINEVTRALDRCDDDDPMHDRIWGIICEHEEIVTASSNYGFRCNTSAVVHRYFEWLAGAKGDHIEHSAYILLSRISELTKPRHLIGWRLDKYEAVKEQLAILVEKDTTHRGEFSTTTSELKPMACEALLALGFEPSASFIEKAIVGESSGHVAHQVAELLACKRQRDLPDSILEQVSAVARFEEVENEEFFRRRGYELVVQSSRSRRAFDSLCQFGLSSESNIFLSSVDAITELAIVRIEEGDQDIPETLLSFTASDKPRHQREASASAFCRLCWSGYVRDAFVHRLIDFVQDSTIGKGVQEDALQAIAISNVELSKEVKDEIWSLATLQESALRWNALEVFLRRDWVGADEEPFVMESLALVSAPPRVQLVSPKTINGWRAYLLGLLYANDHTRFAAPVASVLAESRSDVLYQLLRPILASGLKTPPIVARALSIRIEQSNNPFSTDTELLSVLAKVSPDGLIRLARTDVWSRWRVEGRTALCEATGNALKLQTLGSPLEIFVPFMKDAAFAVRRSAYRELAHRDHKQLWAICQLWHKSNDIETEKRAAEIVEWLPRDIYPDELIHTMNFRGHREPEVREAFEDVFRLRRHRNWAGEYVTRLLALCLTGDENFPEKLRLSNAIAKLGDDESMQRISDFMSEHKLPITTRNLLRRTLKQIEKQWKQKTSSWPETWSHVTGEIEELEATFVDSAGNQASAHVLLWLKHSFDQREKDGWGGIATELSRGFPFPMFECELTMKLADRVDSMIFVTSSVIGNNSHFKFRGHLDYPKRIETSLTSQRSFDLITDAIRSVRLGLPATRARELVDVIQPVLERIKLNVVVTSRGLDGFQVQDLTLAVRELIKETNEFAPQGIVTFKLLEALGNELRFTVDENREFVSLAISVDEDALLVWLKEKLMSAHVSKGESAVEADIKLRDD